MTRFVGHVHLVRTLDGYEVLYVDGRKWYQGTGMPSESWLTVLGSCANRRVTTHVVWYDDPDEIPDRFPDTVDELALPTTVQLRLLTSHP